MKSIQLALNWSFYGLTFLSWVHTLIIVSWATSILSPLFSNGIWHSAPITFEILIIKLLSNCIGVISCGPKDLKYTQGNVITAMVFLVVAIGFNITHLTFSCIEIVQCTSFFCLADYYYLLLFIILLGCLIILEGVLIYYLNIFRKHLTIATQAFCNARDGKPKSFIWWIQVFSWVQTALLCIWAFGAYVKGFSNGLFHSVPIAYEILLFKLVSESVLYSLTWNQNVIEGFVEMKPTIIRVLLFCLVLGIVFNVTHVVFSGIEIRDCESELCQGSQWFLVLFIIILCMEIVVEVVYFAMCWQFGKYLKEKEKSV